MPVQIHEPQSPQDAARLTKGLVSELQNPSQTGGPGIPHIDIENTRRQTTRIVVIWDDPEWANFDQLERSEIIMNAYLEAKGQEATIRVTIAMGLTPGEAVRLGVNGQH